jgi:hypothetical protein
MDGPEDARQKFLRGRIDFKFHQFAVEPVQVLITFDQEFLDQVVHGTTLFAAIRLVWLEKVPWRGWRPRACESAFPGGHPFTQGRTRHMQFIVHLGDSL